MGRSKLEMHGEGEEEEIEGERGSKTVTLQIKVAWFLASFRLISHHKFYSPLLYIYFSLIGCGTFDYLPAD